MKRKSVSLIDVLQPKHFQVTPERARVTRTIMQPEIDSFEQMEAQTLGRGKSTPAGRQGASNPSQGLGA